MLENELIALVQKIQTIENPGGLYGRMTLDRLGKFAADTRNPAIANAMEEYGLPEPKFESDRGIFKVTLYNRSETAAVLDPNEEEILRFCNTPRSRADIKQLFRDRMTVAYVMEKYIKSMTERGLIGLTIPAKPKSKYQKYYTIK